MMIIMRPGARKEQINNVVAAIAAGAAGLIAEVHNDPASAVSDGRQSLTPESFASMLKQVQAVAEAVGRRLAPVTHEQA